MLALMPTSSLWAQTVSQEPTDEQDLLKQKQGFYHDDMPMPDMVRILPPPPENDNPRFYNDWYYYQWGKSMRVGDRYEQAIQDADYNKIFTSFNGAMGIALSEENTPVLWKLMKSLHKDLGKATKHPKDYYKRVRPFATFNEPCGDPNASEKLASSPSYPSGHTTTAWGIGLVLAEINPEGMDSIFSRAYQVGISRVILGVHYKSDTQAGYMLASMVVAHLHSIPAFMELLQEAKAEFLEKKSATAIELQPTATAPKAPAYGKFIENRRLVIRKNNQKYNALGQRL